MWLDYPFDRWSYNDNEGRCVLPTPATTTPTRVYSLFVELQEAGCRILRGKGKRKMRMGLFRVIPSFGHGNWELTKVTCVCMCVSQVFGGRTWSSGTTAATTTSDQPSTCKRTPSNFGALKKRMSYNFSSSKVRAPAHRSHLALFKLDNDLDYHPCKDDWLHTKFVASREYNNTEFIQPYPYTPQKSYSTGFVRLN